MLSGGPLSLWKPQSYIARGVKGGRVRVHRILLALQQVQIRGGRAS
jgi:hypothetical protein